MSEVLYKVVNGRLQIGNINDVFALEAFSKFLRRKQPVSSILPPRPKQRAFNLKKHNYTFKNNYEKDHYTNK